MASPEALLGGAAGLVLLVLLLPFIIFLVALWRIGTGVLDIGRALHGPEGTKSITESAELQAEALAAFVNKSAVHRVKRPSAVEATSLDDVADRAATAPVKAPRQSKDFAEFPTSWLLAILGGTLLVVFLFLAFMFGL